MLGYEPSSIPMGAITKLTPLGDHWLHGKRNEEPGGGEAENRAGQAGDQDVKGAGFCHGSSSDLFVQANLEHGGNVGWHPKISCGISHVTNSPRPRPQRKFQDRGLCRPARDGSVLSVAIDWLRVPAPGA